MNTIPIKLLLTQWYATPLSRQAAQQLAHTARKKTKLRARSGIIPFSAIMQQTIADWWLEPKLTHVLSRGMHYATSKRKMALYHLISGQLLMSCKMALALDYLDMGLRHADGLLGADDYFTLYNRHEELRHLALSASRQKPRDLPALLNESRVMRKLAPHSRYTVPSPKKLYT